MTTHPSEKQSRFDPEPMPRRDFLGMAALGSMAAAFALSIFGMLKLPKAAVSASPAKKFNVALPDTLPEGEAFVPPGRMSQSFVTAKAFLLFRPSARIWDVSSKQVPPDSIVHATARAFKRMEPCEKAPHRNPCRG